MANLREIIQDRDRLEVLCKELASVQSAVSLYESNVPTIYKGTTSKVTPRIKAANRRQRRTNQ